MESVRQGNIYFYGNSLPTLYTNTMKKVPLILCVKKGNYFKTINKKCSIYLTPFRDVVCMPFQSKFKYELTCLKY